MPGILKALLYNEKRENIFLKYFEIGSINQVSKRTYNSCTEKRMLCIGYLGNQIKTWRKQNPFDAYDVKADITMLMNNLGINNVDYKVKENIENNHQISIIIDNAIIGNIYSLTEELKNKFKFDNNVIICDLNIESLNLKLKNKKNKYESIISFPSIKRDIAILVSKDVTHEDVVLDISNSASNLLKEISLFDIYSDESLGKKTKSLAYSLKFQSSKKTLKFEDVDKEINLILKNLKNNLSALQR